MEGSVTLEHMLFAAFPTTIVVRAHRCRDAKPELPSTLTPLAEPHVVKEREGFPLTSIREINVMLNFHHPNIVHVSEICVGKRDDQVCACGSIIELSTG